MPSYFRVMPRELCPLKLSGIGSVVRQSNEVSSAAGGMSGYRSHQLHRHLVNSSAITVNKSCSLLTFLWRPSPGDAGLCTEALWGVWGVCVCEDNMLEIRLEVWVKKTPQKYHHIPNGICLEKNPRTVSVAWVLH